MSADPGDYAPIGTQPQTETHIQCLECGRWYRALSAHLWLAHGIRPDDYRSRHGLRVHNPLAAKDVLARLSEASTATAAARADVRNRLREAMRRRVAARRSGRATRRAAETKADWLRPELVRDMAERRAALNRRHGAQTIANLERVTPALLATSTSSPTS